MQPGASTTRMSGFPDLASSSVSTAGYEDGLGRRSVRFNREVGGMLECLHLRPQFVVFEAALRARAEQLARLDDERFALVRGFEKDAGGLRVISDLVAGHRLIDVLETRSDDGAVSGIDAAFGFLLQAMPAIAELHGNSIVHGALAAGRIIITANSQVVLLDSIYGEAVDRLNLSPHVLWTTLGIMTPAGTRGRDTDVAQVALCALLVGAGRPLDQNANLATMAPLIREVTELAEIRAGSGFADGVRRFFNDTLPAAGKRLTLSADDATAEVRRLLTHINEDESLSALAELVSYRPPTKPAVAVVAPVIQVRPVAPPPRTTPAAAPIIPDPPPPLPPRPAVTLVPVIVETAAAVPVAPEPAVEELPPAPVLLQPAAPPVPVAPFIPQPRAMEPDEVVPSVAPVWVPPPPPIPLPFLPAQPTTPAQQRIPVGPPLGPPAQAAAPFMPTAQVAHHPAPPILKIREDKPAGYAPIRVRTGEPAPDPEPTARALSFLDRAASEPGGRFPWKIAAAAVLVLFVGAAAGRDYLLGRSEPVAAAVPSAAPAPPAPVSTTTGALAIDSQPSGAKVTLDGKDAGVTPLTIEGLNPGRHQVTITSGAALVQRSVRIEAGKQATISLPVFSGWVAIFAPIRLEVSEGRRSLGSTDDNRILLPPGRHVLTLSSEEFGYSETKTVEISPGEERVLNLRPMGTVNLNASPWAEVWVDGTRAGETPLANLKVPLGTREFTFKHPQYGERKLTATITTTASALTVDFGRPPSKP